MARPRRKRDAIDTDQITPSDYCVSESLDALESRWKEGAFRYLMPEFRERVRRGENFLVVGDRFGIGSSREMSPAGLKAVAAECGTEVVVICGGNCGPIFRANAINVGLHIVENVEASQDADDGHRFTYTPSTGQLVNTTIGKSYKGAALSAHESEVYRWGGLVRMARHLRSCGDTRGTVTWPPPELCHRMSMTEQILWAHRTNATEQIVTGECVRLKADLLPASDGTAPLAIHVFNQISQSDHVGPKNAVIVNDHFVFTGRAADAAQLEIGREFARRHGLVAPLYSEPGAGIFHFYLPEQGLVKPGALIAGADSHSRAYGAYGALGIGIGSTMLGFGWATGTIYLKVPSQVRVVFHGRLYPWISGKDVALDLIKQWSPNAMQGRAIEFVDEDGQLPTHARHTIANMMAEAEAVSGVFTPDSITRRWCETVGILDGVEWPHSGARATFEQEQRYDLSRCQLYVAQPHHPSFAVSAQELACRRIRVNKAFVGSCTNGSYEDLLDAAVVLLACQRAGVVRVSCELTVFPGSRRVLTAIRVPERRLEGQSVGSVIAAAGGHVRESWCGPCFGQGPDALGPGDVAITSFNRNWPNRMGRGGNAYLASPVVVASSAIAGYICGPDELGISQPPSME